MSKHSDVTGFITWPPRAISTRWKTFAQSWKGALKNDTLNDFSDFPPFHKAQLFFITGLHLPCEVLKSSRSVSEADWCKMTVIVGC